MDPLYHGGRATEQTLLSSFAVESGGHGGTWSRTSSDPTLPCLLAFRHMYRRHSSRLPNLRSMSRSLVGHCHASPWSRVQFVLDSQSSASPSAPACQSPPARSRTAQAVAFSFDDMAVLSAAPLQFVASIPPVTRAFTIATVAASLLYYWLWWTGDSSFSVPYLVLIPGSSIFYPWVFVTSALVETGVIEVRSPPLSSDRLFTPSAAAVHAFDYTRLAEVS